MNRDIADYFSNDGLLAKKIQGFTSRKPQSAMAKAVLQALTKKNLLLVEAGTGTGKTYAYLVPAIKAGGKVVISTGTKNLQDQLFFRDLPKIKKALGVTARTALLKGRANYVCLQRLNKNLEFVDQIDLSLQDFLLDIKEFTTRSESGDLTQHEKYNDKNPYLSFVTSTKDNCLVQKCPHYKACYLVKAREKALKAEVVVVNHHLFFADLALKDTGFGELLPTADSIIVDEAHHLPAIAAKFFTQTISAKQIELLSKDAKEAALEEAGANHLMIGEKLAELTVLIDNLKLQLSSFPKKEEIFVLLKNTPVLKLLTEITELLLAIQKIAELLADLGPQLKLIKERIDKLSDLMQTVMSKNYGDHVCWYEVFARNVAIHLTPLNVSEMFKNILTENPHAWVFTSATLTTNNQFDFFAKALGITPDNTLQCDSPFEYEKQALLYSPRNLPDPNHFKYTELVVEHALPLLKANKGRAFMLFTSHAALNKAAELLSRSNFNLFVQGTGAKGKLIDDFNAHENAILLGTSSFWEGVDIKGEALSLVIIDKLPFASPGDPILSAKIRYLKNSHQEPFNTLQLPHAALALKQGAGRLIRDVNDSGVLMIADPRLVSRGFSDVFLKTLPPMKRTRNQALTLQFLREKSFNQLASSQ